MLLIKSILSRLSELKNKVKFNNDITFYISVMDFDKSKIVSSFHSSIIDDVIWYLTDKSLTTSIMTIQLVGDNEIGIILKNENRYETNINDVVLESIMELKHE